MKLNERQKERLGGILYHALIELRTLIAAGKRDQALDLTQAVHNLPLTMHGDFNLDWLAQDLRRYEGRWHITPGRYSDLALQVEDE
jgi:hypothetical protein